MLFPWSRRIHVLINLFPKNTIKDRLDDNKKMKQDFVPNETTKS